ncbi:MAG: YciI family protein [Trebonia sp.]
MNTPGGAPLFLVLITYLVPESEVAHLRAEHYEFADRHFATGTFLFGGQQVPLTGGFILARLESAKILDEVLAEDPYLKAGLAQHDVIQLRPMRAQASVARALGLPPE